MIAAFSKLHADDTKKTYFIVIILSHLIQLLWPMYQKLYINVPGAVDEFLGYYAFNRNNLSLSMIVLLRLFLCACFHSLNLKYSVLVCQTHSIFFTSLVDSTCTCISAVGHELVKRWLSSHISRSLFFSLDALSQTVSFVRNVSRLELVYYDMKCCFGT